ncbi:hypothetical protein [Burkholderia cepacia]|uniref:hypothetical protein n=1 Tax=Burkholderia cepacia TaxID=292 RepID=UPI000F5E2F13|nr:hypothetical protein [Burkholderia cepacia]
MTRGTWRATRAPPLREAGKPARRKRRCRATPGVRSAWLQSKGTERRAERALSRHTPASKPRDPASERRREMTTDNGQRTADSGRTGSRQRLRFACIAAMPHSPRMTNDLHHRFPFIKNTLRSDYLNFLNLIKKSLTRRFLSCYLSPQEISPGNRIRIRESTTRQSTSVFITFQTTSS